jgi:hypothetical protein
LSDGFSGLGELRVLALLHLLLARRGVLLLRVLLQVAHADERLLLAEDLLALGGHGVAGGVAEVVLEVGLAEGLARSEDVDPVGGDARRDQLDVRLDAHLLDAHVTGGEVLGDGELEGALVVLVPAGEPNS